MIEPGLWDMIMRLRSRGISDARVIRAFEEAPRSRFLPEEQRASAYEDTMLPLPCGQLVMTPLLTAQMLQLAELAPDSKVLVVGAGSGQLVGLAACMSRRVYSIERYRELLNLAESHLSRAGVSNATLRWGDGAYGWKAAAPFDCIIVAAGLKSLPTRLLSQLAPGGRIVGGTDGQLSVTTKQGEEAVTTPFFPADLPALEPGKSEAL